MENNKILTKIYWMSFICLIMISSSFAQVKERNFSLEVYPGDVKNVELEETLGNYSNVSYTTTGGQFLPSIVQYTNRGVSTWDFIGTRMATIKFDLKISNTAAPGTYTGYVAYAFKSGFYIFAH